MVPLPSRIVLLLKSRLSLILYTVELFRQTIPEYLRASFIAAESVPSHVRIFPSDPTAYIEGVLSDPDEGSGEVVSSPML